MNNKPAYLVVGQGRWGSRMHTMLEHEGRRANFATNMRRTIGESDLAYESRMAGSFKASGAHIAWLCVPPGPHVPPMVRAAISAGLHVLVEKPWIYSQGETSALLHAAHGAKRVTGVHFEYCLLSHVENWRTEHHERHDLSFGGTFNVGAGDHLGISATQNLGSHLLAIHAYAVPHSKISSIQCAYQAPNQRRVWLEAARERIAEIDFLGSPEPIIQRFVAGFENSLEGIPFPLDFSFALRVKEKLAALQTGSQTNS
jgi:Oxidoreductase family, NAD-binding Rossmann fold